MIHKDLDFSGIYSRSVDLHCLQKNVRLILLACKGFKCRTEVEYLDCDTGKAAGESLAIVKIEFGHEVHSVIFYKSVLPSIQADQLVTKTGWKASPNRQGCTKFLTPHPGRENFIKSVGEEYHVCGEYHGCGEVYNVKKGSDIISSSE